MIVQLFGVVVYSNPLAPQKSRWFAGIIDSITHCCHFNFRRFADQSIDIFLKTLYLPMVTTELLLMSQTGDTFLYVYIFIYLLILIPHMTTSVRDCLTNLLVLLHFCLALLLSFSSKLDHDDKYWLWHFLCLFVLNHFFLPQISRKFSIPLTDLSSLSLLFLNIFLINSFAWSRMSMKEIKVVVISCWFTKNIQREEETKRNTRALKYFSFFSILHFSCIREFIQVRLSSGYKHEIFEVKWYSEFVQMKTFVESVTTLPDSVTIRVGQRWWNVNWMRRIYVVIWQTMSIPQKWCHRCYCV